MRVRVLSIPALLAIWAFAVPLCHGHEETLPVVIDTDMAIDDARAIALLATDEHVEILAAVATEGASRADVGAANLARVLAELGREDVPVGRGADTAGPAPPWRDVSETLGWTVTPGVGKGERAEPLLERVLSAIDAPVTYLCLGPATTLAGLLERRPDLEASIAAVHFLGAPPPAERPSFNARRDAAALRALLGRGVPLRFVWLDDGAWLTYDQSLLEEIERLDSSAARLIGEWHADARVRARVAEGHLRGWDETLVLSLLHPALFEARPVEAQEGAEAFFSWDRGTARWLLLGMLDSGATGGLARRRPVVLGDWARGPVDVRADVAELLPKLLERHGHEEWIATMLTSELHRHLGIYSLIGAKMGIRARELLSASHDELEVVSAAGLTPPLSCLNDGLQVSTGASLGRGTIRVDGPNPPRAEALFITGSKRLRLRLRDDVVARIRADIQAAAVEHGRLTRAYFARVRELSLEYWLELDRDEIFVETDVE